MKIKAALSSILNDEILNDDEKIKIIIFMIENACFERHTNLETKNLEDYEAFENIGEIYRLLHEI